MDASALRERQEELLGQMAAIGAMKRGSVTHQRVERAGGRVAVHPLLSWKQGGRTRSVRLRSEEDLAWAEQAVRNHQRFVRLVREYEDIGEQLAMAQRESAASEEAVKKGL